MLTYRNLIIFLALNLLTAAAWAQKGPRPLVTPVPPSLATPPPAGSPASPSESQPSPAPYDSDSYFVPVQPNPGFDYFEDEEDSYSSPYSSGSSSSSRRNRPAKDSFQFVEPSSRGACRTWGNPLLDSRTFSDRIDCENTLEDTVDRGIGAMDDVYDHVERWKLKKAIRGDIRDRAEVQKYHVDFEKLRETLRASSKEGCTCRDR